jgi:hypothetical protein
MSASLTVLPSLASLAFIPVPFLISARAAVSGVGPLIGPMLDDATIQTHLTNGSVIQKM